MMLPLEITAGAKEMMVTDPNGWTLTLVSVTVVFAALVILYYLYTWVGNFNSGKWTVKLPSFKCRCHKVSDTDAVAAAIALALDCEMSQDTEVAIVTALSLYMFESVHDVEPGIITINQTCRNGWDDKKLNFRKKPL